MLQRLETVGDLHGAPAAHYDFNIIKGIDIDLLHAGHIDPFFQKGDAGHVFIEGVAQFLGGKPVDMVGAADDVLGDKFPQEFSRFIPVPLRGQLVCVFFRTVFLDVFKDLVVGQCFLPCGSKEHII